MYLFLFKSLLQTFLDVRVSKDSLKTALFVKPTYTHQNLYHKSCHPYHTKRVISYGKALQYMRIISDDLQLVIESEKLDGYLSVRGFPESMVKEKVNRAILQNRDILLKNEQPLGMKLQGLSVSCPDIPPSLWKKGLKYIH